MNNLKIIALKSVRNIGDKVNYSLKKINKNNNDYLLPIKEDRFSNGEGKVKINDTIRDGK